MAEPVKVPEKPKEKRIDISDRAKSSIRQMQSNMNSYIQGILDEKGIEDNAEFDMRTMQIVVKEK